jgi:hypothetical protein
MIPFLASQKMGWFAKTKITSIVCLWNRERWKCREWAEPVGTAPMLPRWLMILQCPVAPLQAEDSSGICTLQPDVGWGLGRSNEPQSYWLSHAYCVPGTGWEPYTDDLIDPSNNPLCRTLLLTPFFRKGRYREAEQLLKVTQLANGRAGAANQASHYRPVLFLWW